jgi:hypothetical protein
MSILAAIAMLLAVAAPASAQSPISFTDQSTDVSCFELQDAGVTVQLGLTVSSVHGAHGTLMVWEEPATPQTAAPTMISQAMTAELGADGSALTASFDLYLLGDLGLAEGEPVFVGTAQLSASLVAVGDPLSHETGSAGGNQQTRIEIVSQALETDGSLSLPGGAVLPVAACEGHADTITFFQTQPRASVNTRNLLVMDCVWATPDAFIVLDVSDRPDGAVASLAVITDADTWFGEAQADLTETSVAASFTLLPFGEGQAGEASLAATLRHAGGDRFAFGEPGFRHMELFQDFEAGGELAFAIPGYSGVVGLEDADCVVWTDFIIDIASGPAQP